MPTSSIQPKMTWYDSGEKLGCEWRGDGDNAGTFVTLGSPAKLLPLGIGMLEEGRDRGVVEVRPAQKAMSQNE